MKNARELLEEFTAASLRMQLRQADRPSGRLAPARWRVCSPAGTPPLALRPAQNRDRRSVLRKSSPLPGLRTWWKGLRLWHRPRF